MLSNNHKFTCALVSKKKETEDVVTLKFGLGKNSKFFFIPGQYLIVYLNGQSGPEGRAYTISSIPGDKLLAITVKKMGRFSAALCELKIGTAIVLEGPTGYFYPDEKSGELVFLAAGIGITPFLSIIRTHSKDKLLKDKKISLFYSNKTKEDTAFFDELNKLSESNKKLKLFYYLTRQKIKDGRIKEFNRIDIKSIKSKLKHLEDKDYFICGSIKFVSDMRRAILDGGVSELKIHTEAFY